jgi:hypothetical protein
MSTPWPSSQVSADARQNTAQSIASPYWMPHSSVSGTSGMATPIATTSSASKAAKMTVSWRFMGQCTAMLSTIMSSPNIAVPMAPRMRTIT